MGTCQYCNPPFKGYPETCRATKTRDAQSGPPWICTRPRNHMGPHVACGGYQAHEMHEWIVLKENSE